ncbi:MAG: NUDIX domain-containing protein [bacterium]|nr:NUDIX domain-containing protein [bacterium]MDZ4209971.1 NUDIX domain-containing protein [Candidatus Curtissbacteria bacterium]
MKITFHLRARALIYQKNKILLAHAKGKDNTFLPGGHIEPGEKAEDALVREIQEELGVGSAVTSYLGTIENSWLDGVIRHHEINLIFEVAINPNAGAEIFSNEDHIEFFWSGVDELDKNNLLPISLKKFIPDWLKGNRKVWWGSEFT